MLKVRWARVSAGSMEKKLWVEDKKVRIRQSQQHATFMRCQWCLRLLLLSPSRRKSTNRLLCRRAACLADTTKHPPQDLGRKKETASRTEAIDHVVPIHRRVWFYRQRGSRKHRNVHARRTLRARVLAAEERVLFL